MSGFSQLVALGGAAAITIAVMAVVNRRKARAAELDVPRGVPHSAPGPALVIDVATTLTDAQAPVFGPGAREIQRQLYSLAFDGAPLDEPSRVPAGGHAVQSAVVAAATETLRTIESRPRYTPRRPTLLPQLLEAINNDSATLREMAQIIGQDPALTGNLLRVANSPLYRVNGRAIESIDRAMVVIGIDGMRAIVAAALFQPVLEVRGVFSRVPELIWEHTLYSAAAAEAHAAQIGRTDPFAAQLLALVLGLGTIVALSVVLDEYAARPGTPPDAGVTVAILDSWAGPTAQRIAASWGLSERIGDALNEQLVDGNTTGLSGLGQSLRFGRMAAALSMLVAAGQYAEEDALLALGGHSAAGSQVRRIWERLRQQPRD